MDIGVIDEQPETDLKELMSVLQRDERSEVAKQDREILEIIGSLGGDGSKYRRERKRAFGTSFPRSTLRLA